MVVDPETGMRRKSVRGPSLVPGGRDEGVNGLNGSETGSEEKGGVGVGEMKG